MDRTLRFARSLESLYRNHSAGTSDASNAMAALYQDDEEDEWWTDGDQWSSGTSVSASSSGSEDEDDMETAAGDASTQAGTGVVPTPDLPGAFHHHHANVPSMEGEPRRRSVAEYFQDLAIQSQLVMNMRDRLYSFMDRHKINSSSLRLALSDDGDQDDFGLQGLPRYHAVPVAQAGLGMAHANLGGYHASMGGYHANQGRYHDNQGGYHASTGGYHASMGGYHANQGRYHANQGGYHANQGRYHANQGGYHASMGGYHDNQGGSHGNIGGYHGHRRSTNSGLGRDPAVYQELSTDSSEEDEVDMHAGMRYQETSYRHYSRRHGGGNH